MEELVYNYKNHVVLGNEWLVKEPKALVLIITGMAEHSERYNDFAIALNKENYSVFCLDHSGQGKNGELGRPVDDFFLKEREMFFEYIKELKEEYHKEVYIFSHSMGSFLAQAYIEKYSDTVKKVVICGSNGKNPIAGLGYTIAKMVTTKKNYNEDAKLLFNLSIGAYDKPYKDSITPNMWLSYNMDNIRKYNDDPLSGFKCSNGFYRGFLHGLASIQKNKNVKNIDKNLKIFIIAGDADPVGNNGKGPKKLFEQYSKFGLNARCKIYEHMKHEILNEDEHLTVYNDVISFYNEE